MKHVYRQLLAVILVPAFLLAAHGFARADNNFQQPVKKSMQIQPRQRGQIVRNGPKPAHHSIGYIKKKKNDSFSHLNH